MKIPLRKAFVGLGALTCIAIPTLKAQDVNYWWSGDGTALGGSGTWNTTDARWGTSNAGPFTTIWPNLVGSVANLEGTGGEITVATPVNARRINVATTGYTISGSSIAFNGTNNVAIQLTSNVTFTINSKINLTHAGNGVSSQPIRFWTNTTNAGAAANFGGDFEFTGSAGNKFMEFSTNTNAAATFNVTGRILQTVANPTSVYIGYNWATPNTSNGLTLNLHGDNQQSLTRAYRGITNLHHDNAAGSNILRLGGQGLGSPTVYAIGERTIATELRFADAGAANTMTLGGNSAHTSNFTGTVTFEGGNSGAINFHAATGGRVNFTNNISGTITSGNLTKTGSGIVALSGNNSYVGATVVNAGTLLVNNIAGSGTGGGNVTVASGAAIGGSGTIGGNLTISSGARFVFSLSETLTLNGTLTLGSGFGVNSLVNLDGSAIDWSLVPNNSYTLMNTTFVFDASNINNFGIANAFDIGGGRSAYFSNGSLVLNVIPEPSSATLFLLTGLGVLALRRRTAKK